MGILNIQMHPQVNNIQLSNLNICPDFLKLLFQLDIFYIQMSLLMNMYHMDILSIEMYPQVNNIQLNKLNICPDYLKLLFLLDIFYIQMSLLMNMCHMDILNKKINHLCKKHLLDILNIFLK